MIKTVMTIGLAAILGGVCSCSKQEPANPFFSAYKTPFGVPPFDEIQLDDYKPAFLRGIEEQQKEIDAIVNNPHPADFENTIAALDQSGRLLGNVSMVFYGLNSANTSDNMQALSKELSPLLSKHSDDVNLNMALFAKVKEVYNKKEELDLDKEQAKLLEETYNGFIRGGANLSPDDQVKWRVLNSRISLLQLTFGQNVLKETNAYRLLIDKQEDLAGLPENVIAGAQADASASGDAGKWAFTLDNPSVMPFLQYSAKRDLREKIFNAYINRGNNGNDADNKEIIKELITLRLEKARLLGYDNFAAYVLENRMAKNADNVYQLLNDVWRPALAKAEQEAADLQAMMHEDGVKEELKGWDWRYYNEKVKKSKFDLDENQIRPYLKLENVRDGMFYVANKLYGVTFQLVANAPLPHEEASLFECKDRNGEHLGVLYLDFFSRKGKRGGAWCSSYRSQSYKDGKREAPIVTVVCNFSRPVGEEPALLSADETETMFHEFGHALHILFRDVHYDGVAGVPRDFVELPSQIMEHWAFRPETLKVFAKHYKTGETIPENLIEKLEKSGKYGQGFATTELLQSAILDMDYHVLKNIPQDFNAIDFENNTLKRLGALTQIPARHRSTYFSHTMTGGYTAGYYSYLWSEVLDADAFEAFVEAGDIFDLETAEKFRKYILTPGGIEEAMTMYIRFRGKEASIDPLLKNRDLK